MTDKTDMISRADAISRFEGIAQAAEDAGLPDRRDGLRDAIVAARALPAAQVADPAHIRAEALRDCIAEAVDLIDSDGNDWDLPARLVRKMRETLIAAPPAPSPDVGALERIADRITAQVDCTRETMKQAALSKNDLFTLELLTSHFLDMANDLRAALAKMKGGA